MSTYYFARYSITMEGDYLAKMQYLYSVLSVGSRIVYRKDNYRILQVEIRKIGEKNFITGLLIKYADEQIEQVISGDTEIQEVVLKHPVLAQLKLIFDVNESMFIYEEDRGHTPKESVIRRVLEIIAQTTIDGIKYPVSIEPITDKYDFIKQVEQLAEVKKIRVSLRPSNPNNRDRWKDIDEKLRDSKITDYKEIKENKKAGESIKLDEDTIAKVMMGEDGYGHADATGIDKTGNRVTLSTKTSEVQAKTQVESNNIESEITDLQGKVEEIKNKPQNNNQ